MSELKIDFSDLIDENEVVPVSKGTRFGIYLIDIALFYIFIMLFSGIIALLSSDPEAYLNSLENVNPILDRIITIIIYAIFMFFQEWIFKGRSIGKVLTKTKVVMYEDGSKPSLGTLFKRNMSRAVPFDQLSFLGSASFGWHDSWSETTVVKIK